MLERYHDAMMSAVRTVGEMLDPNPDPNPLWLLLRTSPGGVGGMSRSWSLVVVSTNLGLLILRVVHVCASTMANGVC